MWIKLVSDVVIGAVFGIGLIIAGMTDPAKVLAFLDVAGHWDPSLMFVMIGAIAVGMIAFRWARQRTTALLGGAMKLPTKTDIDKRLVVGSVLFGAGWGLAGFCPGPALVAVATGDARALLFMAAMLAGMAVFAWWEKRAP